MKKALPALFFIFCLCCKWATGSTTDTTKGLFTADVGSGFNFYNNTALQNLLERNSIYGFSGTYNTDYIAFKFLGVFHKPMFGFTFGIGGRKNEGLGLVSVFTGYKAYQNRHFIIIPNTEFQFQGLIFSATSTKDSAYLSQHDCYWGLFIKTTFIPVPKKKLNPSTHWGCIPGGRRASNAEFSISFDAGVSYLFNNSPWDGYINTMQDVAAVAPNLSRIVVSLRLSIGFTEIY